MMHEQEIPRFSLIKKRFQHLLRRKYRKKHTSDPIGTANHQTVEQPGECWFKSGFPVKSNLIVHTGYKPAESWVRTEFLHSKQLVQRPFHLGYQHRVCPSPLTIEPNNIITENTQY